MTPGELNRYGHSLGFPAVMSTRKFLVKSEIIFRYCYVHALLFLSELQQFKDVVTEEIFKLLHIWIASKTFFSQAVIAS